MALVLDASVAVSWALEPDAPALALLAEARVSAAGAIVPAIWPLEVRNALLTAERRGRIVEADVTAFLNGLGRVGISVDRDQDERDIMALARRHRLTAYDAAYLELAVRKAIPLATLDRALAGAAREAGVRLLDDT